MTGVTAGWIWGLTLIAVLVALAVLPTFIALVRGADEVMLIILINALCCATVIGWPVALVMAIKWPRKYPRTKKPTIHRSLPPIERHRTDPTLRGPYA